MMQAVQNIWSTAAEKRLCDIDHSPVNAGAVEASMKRSSTPQGIVPFVLRMLQATAAAAPPGQKLAVTFDLDATMFFNDDRYTRSCGAVENTPISEVYKKCIELGIDVFYITAREEGASTRSYTEEQLACLRRNQHKALFLRPAEIDNWPDISKFKYKCREKIVKKLGYRVILNTGDAWTDVMPMSEEKELTRLEKADVSHFWLFMTKEGDHYVWQFKLPNDKKK